METEDEDEEDEEEKTLVGAVSCVTLLVIAKIHMLYSKRTATTTAFT